MKAAACTVDSSCVIALDHLGLLGGLTYLFSSVLVPKAVRIELYRRRETKDRIQRLFRDFHFIERCNLADPPALGVLLAGRADRDRGEAEAIMQASQGRATRLSRHALGARTFERSRPPCRR